jgi:chromosome segregation ATPase
MAMTNHSWEEETKKYLIETERELAEISKQLEELQVKRDNLLREVEAFNTALAAHLRKTGRHETLRQDIKELLRNQKNHSERLQRIAEQNNGILRIGSATDILYNNQIMKTKSRIQAYRTIYALTLDMVAEGIFYKSGRGEFKLVGTQPTLPVASDLPK